jgi:hypothetical protein
MMDVPVLTAIIGVSDTLLGTIVGGCLTAFTNILLQKHREQAEFRMVCRLITGELQEHEAIISAHLKLKRWWPSELQSETQAWEEHQHILASYLPYEAWFDVRLATMGLRFTNHLLVNARAEKDETIAMQTFEYCLTTWNIFRKAKLVFSHISESQKAPR